MLYGIDAHPLKDLIMEKMEIFQRKVSRQLQFLPSSPAPANAAIYGLLGAKPIEHLIDSAIRFPCLAMRDVVCTERAIAVRQLAVKSFNNNAWLREIGLLSKSTFHRFMILSMIHLQKMSGRSSPVLQSKNTGMLRLLLMPSVNLL